MCAVVLSASAQSDDRTALAVEAVGAVILTLFFARDPGGGSSLWQGVFHAISAFCNAGFSLFSMRMKTIPVSGGMT